MWNIGTVLDTSGLHGTKKHRGDGLKEKFWQAVYAYNMADFDLALQEMDVLSTAAVEDFKALKPKTFCRFGFRIHTKCNLLVKNLAETFNGWILESRSKPILGMLEDIRRAVMERLFLKRTLMERAKDDICPRIRKKLETNKEYAKTCHVLASDKMEFEVLCGMEVLIVNLESKSCTCRRWDLTGIPCSHVIACSNWLRMPCEELVDPILKKGVYLAAYSGSIKPIRGERHWDKVEFPLLPPNIKVGAGRPRKMRKKAPHEREDKAGKLSKHGIQMTCSLCKGKNHNKRGCPTHKNNGPATASTSGEVSNTNKRSKKARAPSKATVPPQPGAPKRGRGRPRKGTNAILNDSGAATSDICGTQQSTTAAPMSNH